MHAADLRCTRIHKRKDTFNTVWSSYTKCSDACQPEPDADVSMGPTVMRAMYQQSTHPYNDQELNNILHQHDGKLIVLMSRAASCHALPWIQKGQRQELKHERAPPPQVPPVRAVMKSAVIWWGGMRWT